MYNMQIRRTSTVLYLQVVSNMCLALHVLK